MCGAYWLQNYALLWTASGQRPTFSFISVVCHYFCILLPNLVNLGLTVLLCSLRSVFFIQTSYGLLFYILLFFYLLRLADHIVAVFIDCWIVFNNNSYTFFWSLTNKNKFSSPIIINKALVTVDCSSLNSTKQTKQVLKWYWSFLYWYKDWELEVVKLMFQTSITKTTGVLFKKVYCV